MSSLANEEYLYNQWHTVGVHQAIFITVMFILAILLGFIVTYLILNNIFDWLSFDSVMAGLMGAFACWLFFGGYLACCGGILPGEPTNLAPATVVGQNIKIIKDKKKLPKLRNLSHHYNNEYMYYAHRADDNLEKHVPANHYKHLFYKTKGKISNIKSLMSYRDPKQQAATKHGGLHYVRKPRISDTFMPRHYSFKMSKFERIKIEYGLN